MRILVLEVDRKVASFLERGLREEGYAVDGAHAGPDGPDGPDGRMKAAAGNRTDGDTVFTATLPAVPTVPAPAPTHAPAAAR